MATTSTNTAARLKLVPDPEPSRERGQRIEMPLAWDQFPVLNPACHPDYLAQFRLLRNQVLAHRDRQHDPSAFASICVMSALPAEGKSFTAANLAATLAGVHDKTVLLIRSGLDGKPEAELGLADALKDQSRWERCVRKVAGAPLYLMPPGSREVGAGSADLTQLPQLLATLQEHFAWIVLDGASFSTSPEAPWLAAVCDGTVMVARRGGATPELLKSTLAHVPSGNMVGIVMNQKEMPKPSGFRVKIRWAGAS